jgi:non-ribosomal peptide synthetase component F
MRDRAEISGLIGFFLDMLVLPLTISEDSTLRQLLQQVRAAALSGYIRGRVPFDRLVAELRSRGHSRSRAVFDVVVSLMDVTDTGLSLRGVQVEPLSIPQTTARFDLELLLSRTPEGLRCDVVYSIDLFDAAAAARLGEDLRLWLGAIAKRPATLVRDVPVSAMAQAQTTTPSLYRVGVFD